MFCLDKKKKISKILHKTHFGAESICSVLFCPGSEATVNLQSVASGDFLLSHYHLFSYLDIDVLRSPPIT